MSEEGKPTLAEIEKEIKRLQVEIHEVITIIDAASKTAVRVLRMAYDVQDALDRLADARP